MPKCPPCPSGSPPAPNCDCLPCAPCEDGLSPGPGCKCQFVCPDHSMSVNGECRTDCVARACSRPRFWNQDKCGCVCDPCDPSKGAYFMQEKNCRCIYTTFGPTRCQREKCQLGSYWEQDLCSCVRCFPCYNGKFIDAGPATDCFCASTPPTRCPKQKCQLGSYWEQDLCSCVECKPCPTSKAYELGPNCDCLPCAPCEDGLSPGPGCKCPFVCPDHSMSVNGECRTDCVARVCSRPRFWNQDKCECMCEPCKPPKGAYFQQEGDCSCIYTSTGPTRCPRQKCQLGFYWVQDLCSCAECFTCYDGEFIDAGPDVDCFCSLYKRCPMDNCQIGFYLEPERCECLECKPCLEHQVYEVGSNCSCLPCPPCKDGSLPGPGCKCPFVCPDHSMSVNGECRTDCVARSCPRPRFWKQDECGCVCKPCKPPRGAFFMQEKNCRCIYTTNGECELGYYRSTDNGYSECIPCKPCPQGEVFDDIPGCVCKPYKRTTAETTLDYSEYE